MWLSKIFSSVGVNVISSVGNAVDELITNDEELALTEIQKKKVSAAYHVKMKQLMLELDQHAAQHEQSMEGALTERLKLDMKSDSWLSKNIRPMTLIFMTVVVSSLAFTTMFIEPSEAQGKIIEAWIPFFMTIMVTIYGFYFGSRGLEKVQKIKLSKRDHGVYGSDILSFDQEPRG